nr:MAG TPA: tail tube protein [Bacteriophage sp.]
MSKLVWDQTGDRLYETGVRQGVLYPIDSTGKYPKGVVWNGLTTVTETPSGAEATALYADDIKYLNLMSTEELGGTIEAYTYPDEFAECDGSAAIATGVYIGQQPRKAFGLCYRTTLGNDVESNEYGYKLHLVYGALASPSEKSYETINDSPDAITFSWEYSTTPVNVTGHKPTASIVIDSTKIEENKLVALEKVLYGDTDAEARLPLPDEVVEILNTVV